ncbi:DUF937 domain-containing protein [Chitinophaga horti]|uniref:DUF937 domain-containing protein n=1 Tax=Chitinophaga horti TaxID=2920382 RepID=A0ABY6J088_9BACT|nr:DUF937 domain-containing protein [Chitinophaga horti]UYQ93083.1 DUF937 domain-containing protein [Chitinophaga horti]
MLDQLLQLVKSSANEAVVNNPAVPNEQNEAVISEASNAVATGLQNELANGNTQGVLSLLSGKAEANESNPVVNNISGNLVGSLVQKFGLNSGTASQIAGALIPMVLGKLVKKTNDPGDSSFNLPDILNSLTGGSASGLNLGGVLAKLGLDKDGDGDVDFQDLTSMLSKGAKQQQQQKGESGGLGGLLGGLFN